MTRDAVLESQEGLGSDYISVKNKHDTLDITAIVRKKEEERLKKQRELKRRFRARQKKSLIVMHEQVCALKQQYKDLYIDKLSQQHQQAQLESPQATIVLFNRYRTARQEAEMLRKQNAVMEKQLLQRDRFASLIDGYRVEFELPPADQIDLFPIQEDSFQPLSVDDCDRLIQESYQKIMMHTPMRGKRVSSGARIFGWSDERCVDGQTVQFSFEKTYPFVSARYLMEQTWALLTDPKEIKILYPSASLSVLQVINSDMVVVRRHVSYPQLDSAVTITMLVFRLKTEDGYFVVYRSLDDTAQKVKNELLEQNDEASWLVWRKFDEQEIAPTEAIVCEENGLPSLYPLGASVCKAIYGGRTTTSGSELVSILLIEVLCIIIRWDQTVAGSALCWS